MTKFSVFALLGVCSLAGFAVQQEPISPFDDAAYWFRGGVDLNGDGVYATKSYEFRDVTQAANPSHAKHAMSLNKDGAEYAPLGACTGSVVMPFAGRILADAPYLRLHQKFVTNGVETVDGVDYPYGSLYANYINLPNFLSGLPSGEACTNWTAFIRFRDLGKVSEKQIEHGLFAVGYNWGNACGIGMNLADKNGTVFPKVYVGSKIYPIDNAGLTVAYGHWCDLAVVVRGRTVQIAACPNVNDVGTVTNRLLYTYTFTPDTSVNPAVLANQRWARIGGESAGKTVVYTNGLSYKVPKSAGSTSLVAGGTHDDPGMQNMAKALRGDVQTFAFWPRALSEAELRDVFTERRPAIIRLGLANGSSREFAAESSEVDASGFHPETWNPVLNAAHPVATVRFTVADGEEGVPQYLRVRPVPGSVSAKVEVAVDGVAVPAPTFPADRDALVLVPAARLAKGAHVLTLTRPGTPSGDYVVDALALHGSWRIGNSKAYGGMVHEATATHPYQYIDPRRFPVQDGNMDHFARGFSGAVSGNNSAHLIPFSLPADLAGGRMLDPIFTFALGDGTAQDFEILVNDELAHSFANAGNGTHTCSIPADLLRPGENVLTLRKTTANGGTWINCHRYMFAVGKLRNGLAIYMR